MKTAVLIVLFIFLPSGVFIMFCDGLKALQINRRLLPLICSIEFDRFSGRLHEDCVKRNPASLVCSERCKAI